MTVSPTSHPQTPAEMAQDIVTHFLPPRHPGISTVQVSDVLRHHLSLNTVLIVNEVELGTKRRPAHSLASTMKLQGSRICQLIVRRPPASPKGSLPTAHNATCLGFPMTSLRSLKSKTSYFPLEAGHGSPCPSHSSVGLCGGLPAVMSPVPS